ncbi:MAG: glycerol-3-phosphate dehydrogenase/oxidase [Bacteroidales bacterium]|nr:glycerol-3-phosphate dehydrogenase/oxidase [Bacteroidales bacterium]
MNREHFLEVLANRRQWDVAVIGGGATGLGIAVDASLRGFSVVLFEAFDFCKGTSSRSTKLVHGGVRYLAQGDVFLVMEALKERGILLRNAPHLVKDQTFIIPADRWWEGPFYTIGLKLYDLLAGKWSFGRSVFLRRKLARMALPSVLPERLKGGILYHDGQFDDTRMGIALAKTAAAHGACLLNYMPVTDFLKNNEGKLTGLKAQDAESGKTFDVHARCIINATGVFADSLRKMENPRAKKMIRPSQGIHIVLDASFLHGTNALMIPKTDDGRVLFAIPWHGKVVVGTTDTPVEQVSIEPSALDEEIDFILKTAAGYLVRPPSRNDILAVFAGLRPLAAAEGQEQKTKEISRRHKLELSDGGMITITGGKWTTYRRMAEETLDFAIKNDFLPSRPCITKKIPLHGYRKNPDWSDPLHVYGTEAEAIRELMKEIPEGERFLHPDFPYTVAEVVWAVREEMARTVEDILARRTRMLFLDAEAALQCASSVAEIMAAELKKDNAWIENQVQAFREVASRFIPSK